MTPAARAKLAVQCKCKGAGLFVACLPNKNSTRLAMAAPESTQVICGHSWQSCGFNKGKWVQPNTTWVSSGELLSQGFKCSNSSVGCCCLSIQFSAHCTSLALPKRRTSQSAAKS